MRKWKWFRKTGSDVTDDLPCKQNGVCTSCNLADLLLLSVAWYHLRSISGRNFGGKFEICTFSHVVVSSHNSSANHCINSKWRQMGSGKFWVIALCFWAPFLFYLRERRLWNLWNPCTLRGFRMIVKAKQDRFPWFHFRRGVYVTKWNQRAASYLSAWLVCVNAPDQMRQKYIFWSQYICIWPTCVTASCQHVICRSVSQLCWVECFLQGAISIYFSVRDW